MKNNEDTITTGQMIFTLTLTMVSTGILTLPRNLADVVPYDHWIVLLAAGLVVMGATIIYSWIIRLKPGQRYFEILCDSLSRPVAYIVSLAYIVYFVGLIGLLTRLFGEVIKVYLLVRTPIEVINVSILAGCIYLSRKGVEVLGRLSTFLFPVAIIITAFLALLSLLRTNFRNLLPVFQITPIEVLGGMPVSILSFLGIEVILFFGANLKKPKESVKAIIAVAIVVLFYLLVVISAFAQFGPIQMKSLVWPTLDLFDIVELPGLFIENVQVIVMSTWVVAVFTTIAPLYLAGVVTIQSMTGFKDQAGLAAPFLPFIYFISLVPKNLAHLYKIVDKFSQCFASIMIFGVPLIVLISLLIQKKMGKGARVNA